MSSWPAPSPTAWPFSSRGASQRSAPPTRFSAATIRRSRLSWREAVPKCDPWARRAGEQDPMNEKREVATKFRVGVFVLVALATFLGAVYALGARARLFEARYTIHAEFTEVGGLVEGATVRLAGVQIGRVSGVNLPPEPGGKVRVDMTIAKRYGDRIRHDSVARIETQGLLGDRIVEITVGTAQARPVKASDVIASRDPFDITKVMSESAGVVKS